MGVLSSNEMPRLCRTSYVVLIDRLPSQKQLLGDRAYRSQPLQIDLFDKYWITLKVPFRSNQYDYKKHPKNINPSNRW